MYKAEKDTTSKTCKAAANMFTALQQVSHRTRIDSIKPQECRVGGWREALRVVWGVLGVRMAVLKAVKSVQSPTEKRCERCRRQRKGRKNLWGSFWVVWGVLGGSEGSPKGRKKCTKPDRKALRTVQKAA